MSLPSEQSSISYSGNNSDFTPYPIPFKFFFPADIVVNLTNAAGSTTTLIPFADYVVTGGDPEAGATGEMVTALPYDNTYVVEIERTVQFVQDTVYTDIGKFPSASIDRSFDLLTMQTQQLDRQISGIFATSAETVAGLIDNKATTPQGVRAAIEEAVLAPLGGTPLSIGNGGTGADNTASAIQNLLANPNEFTIGTDATVNFVFAGDSLTTDVAPASGSGNSWPEQVMPMSRFANQGSYYNTAVSGRTLAQLITAYASEVYPRRPAGSILKSYLFVAIGTNGFNTYATAADFITAWQGYITQAKADGFTVIAFTIMRNAATIDYNAMWQQVNIGIRRSSAPNILIDWASWFPSPYDGVMFVDQTHLTALGNFLTAQRVNAAMEQVGNVGANPNPGPLNTGMFLTDTRPLPIQQGPVNSVRGSSNSTQCFLYGVIPDPGTGDYTAGFWVNWRSGLAIVFGKAGQIGFGVNGSGFAYFEGGGLSGSFTSKIQLQSYTWYHLVFSRSSGAVYISINGVRSDVKTSAGLTTQAPNRIMVPGNSTNYNVSNVFWYSKYLQRGEIEQIYQNGGIPFDLTNLEVFIPCDEGIGNQLRDTGANQYAFEPQTGTGTLVWSKPETRKVFKYYAEFAHGAISSTAATTTLISLPKNCKITGVDWNFTTAFDAAVTLGVGITGTANKFVSAQAASALGLFYSDSSSKAIESTSAATSVWIKKSGATTVGAVKIIVSLEVIALAQ